MTYICYRTIRSSWPCRHLAFITTWLCALFEWRYSSCGITFFLCSVTDFKEFCSLYSSEWSLAAGHVGTDIANRFPHSRAFVTLDIAYYLLPTYIFKSPNHLRYVRAYTTCYATAQCCSITEVLCLSGFIDLIYPGAWAWWPHQIFVCMLYGHNSSIHFSCDTFKAKKRMWMLYIPKVKISSISCISFYSKNNKSGSNISRGIT